MSHAATMSPRRWATSFLSLVVVFGLLYAASRAAPDDHGALGTISAVGFLLLGGALLAEVLEPLRVPHLTGYLAVGIIGGPYVLHLIDHESVQLLSRVNSLALALISLAGGAQLRVRGLREAWKSLALTNVVQTVAGIVLVGATFVAARSLMPFTRTMSLGALVGFALLWGVLATTRSPSAVLAVLSQTRATGPLTRYSIGAVMTSGIVVVVVLAAALTLAKPLITPGATLQSSAFTALGHALLGSISIGTTLGLVMAAYVKLVGKQLVVVLLALGFGASEILAYLSFDPLLTFMVAGFVVQNLSQQGDKLLHEIEQTGGIVYVVFFATAGAHLDIPLLSKVWPVTLLLCGVRFVVIYVGTSVAGAITKDEPRIARWGWTSLVPQAGLALGVAALVEREFPGPGSDFKSLGFAAAALNEVLGPILFKIALDRTGESRGPTTSVPDAAEATAAADLPH